jgi:metal-sulfur cluster biosynthetic enzyme
VETKWGYVRPPTSSEERKIVGKVIELGILAVMNNHCYKCAGKMYTQTTGCAIGLALSGIIARIRMNRWKRKMKEIMDGEISKCYMMEKYVDDVNMVVEEIPMGVRWVGSKTEWKREWEEKDKQLNESKDRRTMKVVTEAANSIERDIKFTFEVAEDSKEKRCPMLDLAVWVEEIPNETKENGKRQELHLCIITSGDALSFS